MLEVVACCLFWKQSSELAQFILDALHFRSERLCLGAIVESFLFQFLDLFAAIDAICAPTIFHMVVVLPYTPDIFVGETGLAIFDFVFVVADGLT